MKKPKKKSNKIKKANALVDYVCKVADTQEFRRLCRYLTLDPLSDEAIDYGGKLVQQPDLKDSLEATVVRDKHITGGTEPPCLFRHMFTRQLVEDSKIQMFVYCSDVTFSERAMRYGTSSVGNLTIVIDIVYSIEVDKLEDYQQRSWAIAGLLMDYLDDEAPQEEYKKILGDVKFEFKETNAVNAKLFKDSSMAVLSIPFTVSVIGMKTLV